MVLVSALRDQLRILDMATSSHVLTAHLLSAEGVAPDTIARLLTWPSLFTGLANFVFMPAALVFGR